MASDRECTPEVEGSSCRAETKTDPHEQILTTDGAIEIKHTLSLPVQSLEQPNACDADVTIASTQMNDKIRIKAKIVNNDCAASSGSYTLRLLTMNENGETHARAYTESWSREDDAPVESLKYFDMEGDVDLLRVRVRTSSKTACICSPESTADP
ncbi:MAG: hypothetical protein O7F71_06825 [Gammaproteobacteria bacterium]|nr:hypothetical protein [Gammaproteobacteria bacterium]